jgi:hypothetical protein
MNKIKGTEVVVDKYTFTIRTPGCEIAILRHKDMWLTVEKGYNAIAALMEEVHDLREKIKEMEEVSEERNRLVEIVLNMSSTDISAIGNYAKKNADEILEWEKTRRKP